MALRSSVSQRGQESAAKQAGISAALTKPVRQSRVEPEWHSVKRKIF